MCRCKSTVGLKWTRSSHRVGSAMPTASPPSCSESHQPASLGGAHPTRKAGRSLHKRIPMVPLSVNSGAGMLLVVIAVGCAVGADDPDQIDLADFMRTIRRQAEPAIAERASAVADGVLRISRSEVHDGSDAG